MPDPFLQSPPVVFTAFANPKGDLANLTREQNGIQDALAGLERQGLLQKHLNRTDTDLAAYFNFLNTWANQLVVFHYGGHADSAGISLQNAHTFFEPLAKELVERNPKSLRLVVLNGCSTQAHVETLLRLGVPAVIATSASIDDELATEFALRFYQNLSRHEGLRAAYESAANYVKGLSDAHHLQHFGEVRNAGFSGAAQSAAFPWGLYVNENAQGLDEPLFPKEVPVKPHAFNSVLTRRLMEQPTDNERIVKFLQHIPAADKAQWETQRPLLREAQQLLLESHVWIIGWELRRLFSIGNDANKPLEIKVKEYIHHCFSAYRLSLQLSVGLLVSLLWDAKKQQPNLPTRHPELARWLQSDRLLPLADLRALLHTLLDIFQQNGLVVPFPINVADPAFDAAGGRLEALETLSDENFSLAHCQGAEIALAEVLLAFPFFTTHQLVTMKKVEYEETRNTDPRYVKDFSILEKKDNHSLRLLRYDHKPSLTYALFFRNEQNAINLFPFFLDYNALTSEQDFHIYSYECRSGASGLRYRSLHHEREDEIHYRATATETREITSEEQKNTEQRQVRLDLVVRQFEDALNTLLDSNERFEVLGSNTKIADNFNF